MAEPPEQVEKQGAKEKVTEFNKSAETAKSIEQGFKLEEIKGDLFSCPGDDSLAHCVSADLRMGKGIAVHFKRKFMGIPELTRQKKGPGSVAVLKRDGRFIYYLITKVRYSNKPTYDTLTSSLQEMRTHCDEHSVRSLSMPRIGCGLDGLNWQRVKDIVKDVFGTSSIHVKIYSI